MCFSIVVSCKLDFSQTDLKCNSDLRHHMLYLHTKFDSLFLAKVADKKKTVYFL